MRDINNITFTREMIDRLSVIHEAGLTSGCLYDDGARVMYQDECIDMIAHRDDNGHVVVSVTYYGPLTDEGIVGYG